VRAPTGKIKGGKNRYPSYYGASQITTISSSFARLTADALGIIAMDGPRYGSGESRLLDLNDLPPTER
jgi:hypothetical protein